MVARVARVAEQDRRGIFIFTTSFADVARLLGGAITRSEESRGLMARLGHVRASNGRGIFCSNISLKKQNGQAEMKGASFVVIVSPSRIRFHQDRCSRLRNMQG